MPDLRKVRPDRGKQPRVPAPRQPWISAATSAGCPHLHCMWNACLLKGTSALHHRGKMLEADPLKRTKKRFLLVHSIRGSSPQPVSSADLGPVVRKSSVVQSRPPHESQEVGGGLSIFPGHAPNDLTSSHWAPPPKASAIS